MEPSGREFFVSALRAIAISQYRNRLPAMNQSIEPGRCESGIDVEDLAHCLNTRLVEMTIEPVSYRDATTWNIRSARRLSIRRCPAHG